MHRRTFLSALGTAGIGSAGASLPARGTNGLTPAAAVEVPGAKEAVVGEDGSTVYCAVGDGFAVVDASDLDDPTVVTRRTGVLSDFEGGPLGNIFDVKVSGDRLLVAGPALGVGNDLSGFAVFDVSDPTTPERIAAKGTDHAIHNAFITGRTVYATGTMLSDEPLVVYDLAGDEPTAVARWSITDADTAWRSVDENLRRCHDVYVANETAYVTFWDAGTWVLDVNDPAAPEPVAHVGARSPTVVGSRDETAEFAEMPGNAHAVRPGPGDLLAVGHEAFDSERTARVGGPGGITLWDLGDDPPRRITSLAPPAVDTDTRYAHNFSFRGERLYAGWQKGGVGVYDLSDPSAPRALGTWSDPAHAVAWAARPVAGGFVASSMFDPARSADDERVGARLYTFLEPDGADAAPARTQTPFPTATPGPTSTPRPERSETSTPGGTVSPASTTDGPRRSSPTATRSASPTPPSTTVTSPGFGPLPVVVAGMVVAWRLARRRRR